MNDTERLETIIDLFAQAEQKWLEQGRSTEQQYALRNFMTGAGAELVVRVAALIDEARSSERALCLATLNKFSKDVEEQLKQERSTE